MVHAAESNVSGSCNCYANYLGYRKSEIYRAPITYEFASVYQVQRAWTLVLIDPWRDLEVERHRGAARCQHLDLGQVTLPLLSLPEPQLPCLGNRNSDSFYLISC